MTAFNEVSARIVKFLLGLRPGSVRESGRSYDFLLQQINRRRAQLHEIDGTQLQAIIHELRCQAWNDSLLVEVFALAADQTERILGLRLFDVQLLGDRKSTRLNSSHQIISYAVFCLKKKNNKQ